MDKLCFTNTFYQRSFIEQAIIKETNKKESGVIFFEDVLAEVDVGFIVEAGMVVVDEPTVPPKKNKNKCYEMMQRTACLPEQVESLSESKSSNGIA